MRTTGRFVALLLIGAAIATFAGPASAHPRALVRLPNSTEGVAGPVLEGGRVLFGWTGRNESVHLTSVGMRGGRPHELWARPAPKSSCGVGYYDVFTGLAATPQGVAFVRSMSKETSACCPRDAPCRPPSSTPYLEHLQSGPPSGPFGIRAGFGPGACRHTWILSMAAAGDRVLHSEVMNGCGFHHRGVARVVVSRLRGGPIRVLARSRALRFRAVAAAGSYVAWVVATTGPPRFAGRARFVEVLNLQSGSRRRLALPVCHVSRCGVHVMSLAVDPQGNLAAVVQRTPDRVVCGPGPFVLALAGSRATAFRVARRVAAAPEAGVAIAQGRVLVALDGQGVRNCYEPTAVGLVPVGGGKVRVLQRFPADHLERFSQLAWNGEVASWVMYTRHFSDVVWLWRPRHRGEFTG